VTRKLQFLTFFFGLLVTALRGQNTCKKIPTVETNVVVLGDVEPVSVSEASRPVVYINMSQHQLAYASVEDYLRTDSSVDIQQRAGAGILSDILVRGASFEQTLVLLNGLRIDSAETSHFNLDLPVPSIGLGSVNILHGAGSTLYGSDAIGGIVNFMTWRPEFSGARVQLAGGSFGTNREAVSGSLVGRRWSEVLSGDRELSTGFIHGRDYRTENISSDSRFHSRAGDTEILAAGDDRAFGADQFFGNYDSWERTKGWFAGLNHQFDSRTELDTGYRRHSDIFLLERSQPLGYKNQHVDSGFQGSLRRRSNLRSNVVLLSGIEEMTEQIRSTNLGNHGRNRGAGYGQVNWRVPARGSLSLGIREELFSGGRWVSSPTAAGSLWLPKGIKLQSSVSYGFRIPTYLDLYYKDPSTVGNPNLKPEKAWNFEGGLSWFPSQRLTAIITGFYSRQKDAIDYIRASGAGQWQATNLSGLHFAGVEASADWRPVSRTQIGVTWSLLKGGHDSLGGLESRYVFNYPVNNGRLQWTWNASRSILVHSRLGVLQRYGKDPYAVWDVSVAREAGMVRPFLQMSNLANTGYAEVLNVRMPGRSIVGGVELSFGRRH